MRAFSNFCIALLFIVPINSWSVTEINLSRSVLAKLASKLETAPNDQRFEFARISLSQLYDVYEKELHRSKSDKPSTSKKIKKLYRWRKATNDYLYEIDYLLSHILAGAEFNFYVNRQDRIIFSVSGKSLMISGLNYSTDRSLETNIPAEFCNLYDCQNFLSDQDEHFVQYSEPKITGYWLIDKNHKADFYTHSGITYRFSNLTNRAEKQEWAINLTQEVLFLAKTLELIKKKGYAISHDAISIDNTETPKGYLKITLNENGDFVHISSPTISKSTKVFAQIKPWIVKHQLKDDPLDVTTIVQSEKYYTDAY